MSMAKRALLYLSRKKVRSLILFVMMFVMGLFFLVGISIRISAGKVAEEVRKSITTGITIQAAPVGSNLLFDVVTNEDGEKEAIMKVPLITESKLPQLLEVEGVSGYYMDVGHDILYTGLNLMPGFYSETIDEFRESGDEENVKSSETHMHANAFYEVFDGSWHPFFRNGALELIEGRHIRVEDEGKAVISEDLAERNHLKIGDKIQASDYDYLTGELYGDPYEAEVIGIFRVNFEQTVGEYTTENSIIHNAIFVGYEVVQWAQKVYNTHYGKDMISYRESRPIGNITLFVDDPEMLDTVRERIKQVDTVDWSYYLLSRYDDDYNAMAKPLRTMILLSTLLAAVMSGGILVILSLILTMWIRGRRREAGILSSIGVKKRQVVAQFLLEGVLVAAAAFVLAGALAKPVTDAVGGFLSNSMNQTLGEQPYDVDFDDGSGDIILTKTPTEPVALEYHLTWNTMLMTLGAMFVIVLAAVLVSSRSILEQKPTEVWKSS